MANSGQLFYCYSPKGVWLYQEQPWKHQVDECQAKDGEIIKPQKLFEHLCNLPPKDQAAAQQMLDLITKSEGMLTCSNYLEHVKFTPEGDIELISIISLHPEL